MIHSTFDPLGVNGDLPVKNWHDGVIPTSKNDNIRRHREWFTRVAPNGFCAKCKANSNLSIDHIVPLWLLDQLGVDVRREFDEKNLQLLCKPCNTFKSNRLDFANPRTLDILFKYLARLKNDPDNRYTIIKRGKREIWPETGIQVPQSADVVQREKIRVEIGSGDGAEIGRSQEIGAGQEMDTAIQSAVESSGGISEQLHSGFQGQLEQWGNNIDRVQGERDGSFPLEEKTPVLDLLETTPED